VSGIETVVLKGDPNQKGVYTIMLRVPAHTQIAAHSHRDDRVATVVSGTWCIGYGDKFDESKLKALPPGSFYTEPPGKTILWQLATNSGSANYRLWTIVNHLCRAIKRSTRSDED
jgi:hypothetical protein